MAFKQLFCVFLFGTIFGCNTSVVDAPGQEIQEIIDCANPKTPCYTCPDANKIERATSPVITNADGTTLFSASTSFKATDGSTINMQGVAYIGVNTSPSYSLIGITGTWGEPDGPCTSDNNCESQITVPSSTFPISVSDPTSSFSTNATWSCNYHITAKDSAGNPVQKIGLKIGTKVKEGCQFKPVGSSWSTSPGRGAHCIAAKSFSECIFACGL